MLSSLMRDLVDDPWFLSCDVTFSFDRYMKQNPDALTWFSKPELALKQRVNDYKNKK